MYEILSFRVLLRLNAWSIVASDRRPGRALCIARCRDLRATLGRDAVILAPFLFPVACAIRICYAIPASVERPEYPTARPRSLLPAS